MKIASTSLQMAASHNRSQQHEISESLSMWVGPHRPGVAGEAAHPPRPSTTVTLSDTGKQAAGSARGSDDEANATVDGDPRLSLIRSMLELLTGRRIKLFDASELSTNAAPAVPLTPAPSPAQASTPAPAASYGVAFERHESYTEAEQTNFSASGSVTTADGRKISFDLQLSMSRSYHEESSVSLRLGDAARKVDPLVLNFSGNAAQLTDQRFSFDLNADGHAEQINFVAPGSGFLVFDRNQDGKINNGHELFGPTTNDGFRELAALDDDRNGWIDESDKAFGQLQAWSRDGDGQDRLQSLAAAGVGAISLNRVATPFDVKTNANELIGQIRSSGIFLHDTGTAGTIQQLDLTA